MKCWLIHITIWKVHVLPNKCRHNYDINNKYNLQNIKPYSRHFLISIHPENVRKPPFLGGIEMKHYHEMGQESFFTPNLEQMFSWLAEIFNFKLNRRSRSEMFFKIGVLKNFAIFTEKYLCWSLFLIKFQVCNFVKKRLQHKCFPVNIAKIWRIAFAIEHPRWLLLLEHEFTNTVS